MYNVNNKIGKCLVFISFVWYYLGSYKIRCPHITQVALLCHHFLWILLRSHIDVFPPPTFFSCFSMCLCFLCSVCVGVCFSVRVVCLSGRLWSSLVCTQWRRWWRRRGVMSLSLSLSLWLPLMPVSQLDSSTLHPFFLYSYCHAFSHIEHKIKGNAGLWCIMSLAKAWPSSLTLLMAYNPANKLLVHPAVCGHLNVLTYVFVCMCLCACLCFVWFFLKILYTCFRNKRWSWNKYNDYEIYLFFESSH